MRGGALCIGSRPATLVDASSGDAIAAERMQELEGLAIADYMELHVLPFLVGNASEATLRTKSMFLSGQIKDDAPPMDSDDTPQSVSDLRDSLEAAYNRSKREAEAYWVAL